MNRRWWRQLVVCACIAGATTAHAAAATAAPLAPTPLPAPLGSEVEPNESPAQPSPLMGDQRVRASLAPAGDVDYYAFAAKAGDRVFANLVTAADTRLVLLGSDGLTLIEADENDGSQFALASSIAGTVIPSDGTYYLEVSDARGVAATPAPYDLYLALRGGLATPEVETENDEYTEANPLINGEATGKYDEAGDRDWFAVNLKAGDTVFLSLDLDPERDDESFDGQLGFGLAGDVRPEWPPSILTVDDAIEPSETTPPSEAETMTVSQSGTYYAYVDVHKDKPVEPGGEADTYDLAVTVFPATQPSCRSYPSSLISAFIDGGTTSFPIPVDDPAQIARAALELRLEETVMADLDVSLRSPAGLEVPIFTDIGEGTAGGQRQMDAIFDDFAAVPSTYTSVRPLGLQTDLPLAALKGQQAQGTWALVIRDDSANLPPSVGSLAATELVICPAAGGDSGPPPSPPTDSGGAGGPGAAQPQARPASAPVLSDLTIAPSKFRAAKAGPMVRAKRSRGGGALVSYRSSEAVETHLLLFELEAGRRLGRKCVRPTPSNASRKPCVRPVKVISFVRGARAGRNRFGFTGRVGARKLPPGEYRLQARGYSTSGRVSTPVSATFTVLPPAQRQVSQGRR